MIAWGIIAAVALGGAALGALASLPATRLRAARLKRALSSLRAENRRLHTELERLRTSQTFSRVGTWDWVVDTQQLHWSDEVYPMFGFRPGEVQPTYALFCAMVHPEDAQRVRQGEITSLCNGHTHDQHYRIVWRDGTVRWLRETGDTIRDATGRPVRMIGTVRDITDEKANEQRMLHLAFHDALTGLPNRAYFRVQLEDALARARRASSLTALAFIDLDRFKPINDRHGHAVGDAVLIALAERLRSGLRETDCVARLGGDEFVVILEGLRQPGEAEALAEKVLATIRTPIVHDELTLTLDASIGIALYPLDADDAETLIAQADQAMYTAKNAGCGIRFCQAAEATAP